MMKYKREGSEYKDREVSGYKRIKRKIKRKTPSAHKRKGEEVKI